MAPVQPVYVQPAAPAVCAPPAAPAQPVYAQPGPYLYEDGRLQHHHHQGLNAGAVAVGAGALGLAGGILGGMLLEEAIEDRWREPAPIIGPVFRGPELFGSEEVIQDVRTDMW